MPALARPRCDGKQTAVFAQFALWATSCHPRKCNKIIFLWWKIDVIERFKGTISHRFPAHLTAAFGNLYTVTSGEMIMLDSANTTKDRRMDLEKPSPWVKRRNLHAGTVVANEGKTAMTGGDRAARVSPAEIPAVPEVTSA